MIQPHDYVLLSGILVALGYLIMLYRVKVAERRVEAVEQGYE